MWGQTYERQDQTVEGSPLNEIIFSSIPQYSRKKKIDRLNTNYFILQKRKKKKKNFFFVLFYIKKKHEFQIIQ
jgi:hypothetical protein